MLSHLDPTSIAPAPVLLLPAATRDSVSSKLKGMGERGVVLAGKGQAGRHNRGGGAALSLQHHPHQLTLGGVKSHV